MFSLKSKRKQTQKPQTLKHSEAQRNNENNQISLKVSQYKNTKNKQKPLSKKLQKKVFQDPFNYKVQVLPSQQSIQVIALLTQYLKKLREKIPYKPPREGLIKTIKFQQSKNIKNRLSPLVCKQISIGIKTTRRLLYKNFQRNKNKLNINEQKLLTPHLVIVFYEEQKHEMFIQLFSLLKILNFPYLILKNSQQINRILGIRTVGSLCLNQQLFVNSLMKYLGKSLADVPWVLNISRVLDGALDDMSLIQRKD